MYSEGNNPDHSLQGKYGSEYEVYYMWWPERGRDRS